MFKLIDSIEFQQPSNYLIDNDIRINDIKIIKEYINSNKRMVNNLKVYFNTAKKARKYELIPNLLLNRRIMDKIDKNNNSINFMNDEINKQSSYLNKLQNYLTNRNLITKLSNMNYNPREKDNLLTLEILDRDSILICNYLNNTKDFVSNDYYNSADVSRQGYLNDILDIIEENISKQEKEYFDKSEYITKNEKLIRDINRESFNNLIKTVDCSDEYPDMSRYRYKQDIKSIYKKYGVKNSIVDNYIELTYSDINNIYDARTNNKLRIIKKN